MIENIEIPVIHDDDLRKVFAKLGIDEKIDNGFLFCPLSGTRITWDNIGAVIIKDGSVSVVCDLPECMEALNQNNNG